MTKPIHSDHCSRPVWQFIGLGLSMAVMYGFTFLLRFSNDGFNIAYCCLFFLLPFLAFGVALRLRPRAKLVAAVLLVPVLGISLLALSAIAIFDIPAAVGHRQLSRELGIISQGRYSVHLAWEETAGGALGPHGVRLEQRKTILPGLYAFRTLDYFEKSSEGSLSAAGLDGVELHIPHSSGQSEIDRIYSLKPWLYF
ncbi:MAG: hypothetical protein ABSE51_12685 [Terracidiphilus sp.]